MKKLNICIAGALALLCTNCGDSNSVNVSGTSEDVNEVADKGSSSSEQDKSSSSTDKLALSSSSGETHTPPAGGNSLDAYVETFGLQNKVRFDKAVIAVSTGPYLLKQQPMDGSDPYTEFEKEGVAKFTQENIGEIEEYFPNAAETYAETVSAVKNGTNECALYSYNSYGNEKYTGLVLEYVSSDTLKVTGIAAKNCEETTKDMFVRFLVSYCGDLNQEPVIIENTVESSVKKEQCPAVDKTEWVGESSSAGVTSSSSETPNSSAAENPASSSSKEIETCRHISDNEALKQGANCNSSTDTETVIDCVTGKEYICAANYWTLAEICAPGSDCDGDGIPDGIRRPDLEPCDTDTLLYFYGRSYQCIENKWVYLPPPGPDDNRSQARNASLQRREGPAVAPSAVMVKNEDNTITIRDDGYNASNNFVIEDVYTELSGDTIIVDVIYPDGANVSSFEIGVLTFTVSKVYANVKYVKYKNGERSVQTIREVTELLPCANNGSCQTCDPDKDCDPMVAW